MSENTSTTIQQKLKKKHKQKNLHLPFVSICTPTFNRRPFISTMIKCFQHQTYPKNRMEWIIIDDGPDKIEDLVTHIPQVKYYKYDEKMYLGKKRNIMHDKSIGDIIVYMDDDDYYPPERVMHAVETLQNNPQALCAGSSEMYLYFKHINEMYKFGPYGPNHSTAATFAFRRELLQQTRYNDNVALAEEREFLKSYTIPFVQLNPLKTILVFSHVHNSVDKKTLLGNPNDPYVKLSDKKVEDFVKELDIKRFFMETIDTLLEKYEPGNPKYKPDVNSQIEEIMTKRKEMEEANKKQQQQMYQQIYQHIMTDPNGPAAKYEKQIMELTNENNVQKEKIKYLENKLKTMIDEKMNELKNRINIY
jgi:glycosyltransferase involved in cell wall biosynthesis